MENRQLLMIEDEEEICQQVADYFAATTWIINGYQLAIVGYRTGRLRFPRTAHQGRRFGTGSDRTTAGWNQRIGAGSADAAAA